MESALAAPTACPFHRAPRPLHHRRATGRDPAFRENPQKRKIRLTKRCDIGIYNSRERSMDSDLVKVQVQEQQGKKRGETGVQPAGVGRMSLQGCLLKSLSPTARVRLPGMFARVYRVSGGEWPQEGNVSANGFLGS